MFVSDVSSKAAKLHGRLCRNSKCNALLQRVIFMVRLQSLALSKIAIVDLIYFVQKSFVEHTSFHAIVLSFLFDHSMVDGDEIDILANTSCGFQIPSSRLFQSDETTQQGKLSSKSFEILSTIFYLRGTD
jgi:hypothetical protein